LTQLKINSSQLKKARRFVKNNPGIQALVTNSPAEIETWIDNNVNNMADAKTVLTVLAQAVSVLVRREINEER
jgi:hypothetical protein